MIVWNADTHRFTDTDTGRLVSALVGLESLSVAFTDSGDVITDEAGQVLPPLADILPKALVETFANVVRNSVVAGWDVYNNPAPAGSYYTVIGTYITPDGEVRSFNIKFNGKVPIDEELERQKVLATIMEDVENGDVDMTYDDALAATITIEHMVTR